MTRGAKSRALYLLRMTSGVVAIVLLFAGMVYLALNYFRYPFWGSMAWQLAAAVVIYKIYRWWRWPGTFHGKTSERLIRDTLLSILFVWSIPVLALVSRLHILKVLPLRRIAASLDLMFPFQAWEPVQISLRAPLHYYPGHRGIVRRVRVVTLNENATAPAPIGSLVYLIGFVDGREIEIPEAELSPRD